MNNDIQNLVNELNSTIPKTQMYMIQLCRSAINNLYDLTDTIEENISSLQTSVVANTSTISGLQGSIDVINTNLSVYLGRIEALETKTTNMSKLGNDTKFSNNVNVDGIITTGDDIISGGVIKGEVLVADNDLGEGRFAIDNDGDMTLYNPANAGKLITTGNIEEYASSKLYLHNMYGRSADTGATWLIQWISTKIKTAFTLETLAQFLYQNNITSGLTPSNNPFIAMSIQSGYNKYYALYSESGTSVRIYVSDTANRPLNADFVDNVFEI